VTVLSWWAARQITAPLTRFADAAERFTTEAANAPLVESGPLEVRRATKALNDMQARVLKLVADRTRMLAAVSHDLRTPITRLRLRAEQIEKDELRMSILRDLATMQRLTHSALAFLRGQSEPCVLAKTELPSLVQTACDGFADIGREVTYSGPPHLYVTCEPEQLLRAVENLVDNSLKFGNSVAVTVRQQGHVAAIEVRDDGPGIVNAEKVVVFEPFYRGDTARNLNNGESFGLGLSIAQNIVQRSGGRLELVDAAPTGLLARVLLPLAGDDGF
jgi:signal transduction histidine kinase